MPPLPQTQRLPADRAHRVEWVTLGLYLGCVGAVLASLFVLAPWSLGLAVVVLTLALVLHSSISHEVLHGHPFPSRIASEALVLVNPGLFVPYLRFRDTHLAHHQDARLTDPYDDPESNYLDPGVWEVLPRPLRWILAWNNTLAGRIVLGPILSQMAFMRCDWRAIRQGDAQVIKGWLLHLPGVALVLGVVWAAPMGLGWYLLACYAALSILKIRTFLEHQAHVLSRGRTVIVEDRGLLAFLFLNNNLHVVHHMHPRVPWYRLPRLYRANAARYLACNEGYRYGSYREVFARHFWRAKDPVAHPLWSPDP
ncbi:fatty acid desaturase [uncultured Tateyamaria sp.]|uniref:fatty acid desaturase n=1 Tax=uncultured Tateyamaria sp. TaxID=455651 RepID=UPI0026338155|nr:fatty acid desaturase [uncultured Tateyamaria sp.]